MPTAFVTVGTTKFDELIRAVDTREVADALQSHGYDRLVMQVGSLFHWFSLLRKGFVISIGGVQNVMDTLQARDCLKPISICILNCELGYFCCYKRSAHFMALELLQPHVIRRLTARCRCAQVGGGAYKPHMLCPPGQEKHRLDNGLEVWSILAETAEYNLLNTLILISDQASRIFAAMPLCAHMCLRLEVLGHHCHGNRCHAINGRHFDSGHCAGGAFRFRARAVRSHCRSGADRQPCGCRVAL